MAGLIFWAVVFTASLFLLVKASNIFTGTAEKIGLHLGLPAFVVGVTIVSVGTSLPELISSILAVLGGNSEIVIGNVIGSNIANILLILGIAAVVRKSIKIDRELIRVDLPLLIASALFLAIAVLDGSFNIYESLIFLTAFGIYTHFTISEKEQTEDVVEEHLEETIEHKPTWRTYTLAVLSTALIYVGAKYTVESIITISTIAGIGTEIIAVSAVALGTSLPELSVTITAAANGKPEIALGNILGSNIFNTFVVMGIPAFFGTLTIPSSILTLGLPMMIIATLLYFFTTQDKEITAWEGATLALLYLFFIVQLFGLF